MKNIDQDIISSFRYTEGQGRQAENQFFSRYDYFIKEGMKKYRLSEDDAFDAYSDAILSVIQNIRKGNFEGRASLKTYTFQVFQNKCVDLVRKRTTHKNSVHETTAISDLLVDLSDATKSILQRMIDQAEGEVLKKKMDAIGVKCRQILMFFSSGYSDKEVAQNLEYKTADVVKTSRLRCLEKLRNEYKNENA